MADSKAQRATFFFTFALCTFVAAAASPAYASAWTQAKGHTQLIVTALHYSADSRFTSNGTRVSQPTYSKNELNPYVEYGLSDALTLGGSTFLQRLDDSTNSRSGLGDTTLFLRQRLWQNSDYVLSFQPEIKLPSPQATSRSTPAIGSAHVDGGVHIIGGMNFSAFGQSHYAEASAGYRYRTGAPKDQYLFSGTLGLRATDRLMLLPQVFSTLRSDSTTTTAFTQSPRDEYSLLKMQASAVYKLTDKTSIQLGAAHHLKGENTAAGNAMFVAYWMDI